MQALEASTTSSKSKVAKTILHHRFHEPNRNESYSPKYTPLSNEKAESLKNVIKSKNGQTLILEYTAPRRSCRINIKITAFSKGKIYNLIKLTCYRF